MESRVIDSGGTEETEAAGAMLADSMPQGGFVAMYGDLGAGKTAFVRGFVSRISPFSRVKSPTFAIVNTYGGGRIPVYHFDFYRIEGEDDLESTGFYDYLGKEAYIIAEWSEKIPFALPAAYTRVTIEKTDGESRRRITIDKVGGTDCKK